MSSSRNSGPAAMPARNSAVYVGWIIFKLVLLIAFAQVKAAQFIYNGF
jgi:hypothetical protein